MRTRFLLFFLLTCIISLHQTSIYAQALATYGNQSITRGDFLKAYHKNNADAKPSDKSYQDYLELYIRYKLKVKQALAEKMDTLPGQLAEAQNFKTQVAPNYMADQSSIDRLVNEAFDRGQKDIHLAHIFVRLPANAGPADTAQAWQKNFRGLR